MNPGFVRLVGMRYFRAKRKSRAIASTLLAVSGIAVGVMTLTTVLAVMNGFQLGFIESILEVSSYHLQIRAEGDRALKPADLMKLRALPEVNAVLPFAELQVIAEGRYGEQRACLVRALPVEVASLDSGFREKVEIVAGKFDIAAPFSLVVGAELARHLGVRCGDTISLISLEGAGFESLSPSRRDFLVTGLFKSGYYEIDLGWAFTSLETGAAGLMPAESGLRYGVKLKDRFRDRQAARRIEETLSTVRAGSWREFNRAFFGALLMEKIFMMVLICLIFIVVGFNIFHTLRRAVRERYEEIGVLKALGASGASIRYIFILEGVLLGFFGALAGMVLGLLISMNINGVFAAAELAVNTVLSAVSALAAPLSGYGGERFALFSPAYFYISEVPSRVLLHEAVLIAVFALASSVAAAAVASRRVADVKPAEILRYE
jgi:lipoprotein-releasing system permease protein